MTTYSYTYCLTLDQIGPVLEKAGKMMQSGLLVKQLNMPNNVGAIMRGYNSQTRESPFALGGITSSLIWTSCLRGLKMPLVGSTRSLRILVHLVRWAWVITIIPTRSEYGALTP